MKGENRKMDRRMRNGQVGKNVRGTDREGGNGERDGVVMYSSQDNVARIRLYLCLADCFLNLATPASLIFSAYMTSPRPLFALLIFKLCIARLSIGTAIRYETFLRFDHQSQSNKRSCLMFRTMWIWQELNRDGLAAACYTRDRAPVPIREQSQYRMCSSGVGRVPSTLYVSKP